MMSCNELLPGNIDGRTVSFPWLHSLANFYQKLQNNCTINCNSKGYNIF